MSSPDDRCGNCPHHRYDHVHQVGPCIPLAGQCRCRKFTENAVAQPKDDRPQIEKDLDLLRNASTEAGAASTHAVQHVAAMSRTLLALVDEVWPQRLIDVQDDPVAPEDIHPEAVKVLSQITAPSIRLMAPQPTPGWVWAMRTPQPTKAHAYDPTLWRVHDGRSNIAALCGSELPRMHLAETPRRDDLCSQCEKAITLITRSR